MPELPPPKYGRTERHPVADPQQSGTRYAELHCRSNFSFLEGASHPEEFVRRAAELGHEAIAITDRNSLAGVVRAHVAARDAGVKLLIGAEIVPVDGPPLVLLATDRAAYGRLSRLVTLGRRRAGKGECQLTTADVLDHAEGLVAGLVATACDEPGDLVRYGDAFGDRCHLLAELHHGPDDEARLERLVGLSRDFAKCLAVAHRRSCAKSKRLLQHGPLLHEIGIAKLRLHVVRRVQEAVVEFAEESLVRSAPVEAVKEEIPGGGFSQGDLPANEMAASMVLAAA